MKELKAPFVTVISPTAKSVVASLDVTVKDRVASLDVNPSDPSAAVIVMVGPVSSADVKFHVVASLMPA